MCRISSTLFILAKVAISRHRLSAGVLLSSDFVTLTSLQLTTTKDRLVLSRTVRKLLETVNTFCATDETGLNLDIDGVLSVEGQAREVESDRTV